MVWVTRLGNNTVTGRSCYLKPFWSQHGPLSLNGYYFLFLIQISSFHKRLYLLTSLSTPFVQTWTVLSKLMYLQITECQISHIYKVTATRKSDHVDYTPLPTRGWEVSPNKPLTAFIHMEKCQKKSLVYLVSEMYMKFPSLYKSQSNLTIHNSLNVSCMKSCFF